MQPRLLLRLQRAFVGRPRLAPAARHGAPARRAVTFWLRMANPAMRVMALRLPHRGLCATDARGAGEGRGEGTSAALSGHCLATSVLVEIGVEALRDA